MESFLLQATIYLAAAVVAVPIASRLGLGSVLGYLLAGIVIGPLLGFVGSETESLQHFAEFGVVMMLFIIGLELEPRALWDMRHRLIGLGGLQVIISTGVIAAGAAALGQPWQLALAIGLIFALSSTAIVLQTLNEKALMQTHGGRSAFSVLLTQDIAVIPMLALLPLLAVAPLVTRLPGWGVTLVTIAAVAAIILAGVFLTRPAFRFVGWANLRELYTAFALLIVVAIACLMILVGLSPALGAFLAGVVLANSEFRHELESDLEPFKGLLLGLFFITVGAGIHFSTLFSAPFAILGLTLAVMSAKGAVLFGLGLLFKLKGRDQWLFTLSLAQAGEFGFVLISFSLQQNVLPERLSETLLLVVALSMLITPLLFIAYDAISRRMKENGPHPDADEIDEQQLVIIAGIGRFGQVVNRLVQMTGTKTIVLDHDLETVQLMRAFGFKGFFGDPTRPELLKAAGLVKAKVLVVALDDKDAALRLVRYARKERPDLHIVARAVDRVHVYGLFRAGANDIVREMFDSSLRAGRYVLENMGFSDYDAAEVERAFYKHDRHTLRELAELWDPSIPVSKNTAYMARARELNSGLETALVTNFTEDGEDEAGDDPAPKA
ncbi:UNVERIFIED_CONTAM: hypothetical protein GTU68_022152 [Idotea baltica]|nr:hypothetical protein [Idotea baltica]